MLPTIAAIKHPPPSSSGRLRCLNSDHPSKTGKPAMNHPIKTWRYRIGRTARGTRVRTKWHKPGHGAFRIKLCQTVYLCRIKSSVIESIIFAMPFVLVMLSLCTLTGRKNVQCRILVRSSRIAGPVAAAVLEDRAVRCPRDRDPRSAYAAVSTLPNSYRTCRRQIYYPSSPAAVVSTGFHQTRANVPRPRSGHQKRWHNVYLPPDRARRYSAPALRHGVRVQHRTCPGTN